MKFFPGKVAQTKRYSESTNYFTRSKTDLIKDS